MYRAKQCRIKVRAVDAAALDPFKKLAHGHGREKEAFSILVVISLLGTVSEKIIKIIATRCHILKLKCTDFGWGSVPDPAGGAYNAPQTLYRDIRATSKGKEGMGREGEMDGKERVRGG